MAGLAGPAGAQPLEKIRVGIPGFALSSIAPRVAEAKGFFRGEGLAADLVHVATSVNTAALTSGEIDYSTATGALLRSAVQGRPVRVLMYFNRRPLYALVARPEISRIEELRGKTVGFTGYGDTTEFMLRAMLRPAGMDMEKDIHALEIAGGRARLTALLSGKVDATLIPPPFNIEAEAKGFRRLIDAAEVLEATSSGLGAATDKLKENPGQTRRVLRALLRAQSFIGQNPVESARVISDWLGFGSAASSASYDIYVRAMSPDGLAGEKTIRFNIDRARESLKMKEEVPLQRVVDFGILNEVLKER
jgi:ABC-type nitrate/sulfonate/bicarbonate transport system substrate-binding protein